MKATVERDELAAGLKRVAMKDAAHPLTVLAGTRVEAVKGQLLRLTRSDLDTTITTHVPARSTSAGVTVIPTRFLSRVVTGLDQGAVSIETGEDDVSIVSGATSVTLRTFKPDAWPTTPDPQGDGFDLTADDLAAIAKVVTCAGTDPARQVLMGVWFDSDGEIAGTDSYRLAVAKISDVMTGALVPADVLHSLLKVKPDQAHVVADDRHIRFTVGATSWTAGLIEKEYPKYRSLIPGSTPHTLTFPADELRSGLGRLNGFISAATGHPVRVQVADREAVLSRCEIDSGDMNEVVPCDGDFDQPLGFNGRHLADLIDLVGDCDEVTLHVTDPLKPVLIRTEQLTLLQMPVRV